MFGKKKANRPPLTDEPYDKTWYTQFSADWEARLLSKSEHNDIEIEEEYLYELSLRIKQNLNSKNKMILNQSEIEAFWNGVAKNLKHLDVSTIVETGKFSNPLKHYLLSLRDNNSLQISYTNKDIAISSKDDTLITKASERTLFIEMMSFEESTSSLTIMGVLTFPINTNKTKLVAEINGKIIQLEDSGLYSYLKVFGQPVCKYFPIRIDYQISADHPAFDISFRLENSSESSRVELELQFSKPMSKLSSRTSYWQFGKYMATHNDKAIHIKPSNTLEIIAREVGIIAGALFYHKKPQSALLRILYWVTKPTIGKQNIWLYADKIYKAGDNAYWLYKYAVKQKSNIRHHYILSDTSPDVELFKKEGLDYVSYKSIFQRLLFLHAKVLIFTHNNAPYYYRYGGPNSVIFRGLFNYKNMYIQHGLTVQDTAWLYKKSVDNATRYFVASPMEKENLLRKEYGYIEEEIVPAGMTRFDGLKNNRKKKIIISPTWRTYLAPPGKDFGSTRDPHELFKKSDFYKIYNSLIKNDKLINYAKKYNYSIDFLLHPVLSAQINDFDQNGFVKIISANQDFNYQEAMTEASLLVTDYSGIQFDFAYMYKPVVYFHPSELPASYDEANYKYDQHALGDIVKKSSELVDLLCDYIEKDCQIKPEYRKRIDKFFYYHDLKSSKRIYEHIVAWQKNN